MDTSLGGNVTHVGGVKAYSGSSLVGKLFAYYLKWEDRRFKQTVLLDVVSNKYREHVKLHCCSGWLSVQQIYKTACKRK